MLLFIILNFAMAVFFAAETVYVDRLQSKIDDANPIVTNILLMAITTGMFTLFTASHAVLIPSMFTILMRFCFVFEACMLINIVFCFPYYAWKYSNHLVLTIKFLLYITAIFFVFFKFRQITVSSANGLVVESDYLFNGSARTLFPWTWYTVYEWVLRVIMPAFTCIVMLIYNERKASRLDRFKGYTYAIALLVTWFCIFLFRSISAVYSGYSLMRYLVYVPILVIIPIGSMLVAAPSGKRIFSFILKGLALYLLPAAILGSTFLLLKNISGQNNMLFAIVAALITGGVLWLATTVSRIISKSKFGHSADYAVSFEKDLATIDYSGEMDEIADTMYHIFKKNTEASFMSVFINGGNDTFETAYSSNKKSHSIKNKETMFARLLNINRNVVIFNELERDHSLSNEKEELEAFFAETESDALFILNEGRDVHGIILLGIKVSGDHFKEYDYNVFTKLYSYFFVFGYYMRNISNKEIIGTVNRELRMSAQIITSIQENMDALDHPKMDAGCIMVPAHNIGGEFVDMIRLNDSRHLFVMGDLSGKGIAASMSMVILKSIIRAYLNEIHDFKKLVVKTNSFIRNNLQKGTIFSGMFAIIDFKTDTLYYINCGVPAIFLFTESYNNVIEIQGSGHILGFVSDISPYISVKQIKLHKNDIVLACTDGLIESHSLRGEQFGKDRIQRSFVANRNYPARRIAQFEYDELMKFMSHEMEDDVSVLVMKYLKSNESEKLEAEEN